MNNVSEHWSRQGTNRPFAARAGAAAESRALPPPELPIRAAQDLVRRPLAAAVNVQGFAKGKYLSGIAGDLPVPCEPSTLVISLSNACSKKHLKTLPQPHNP